MQSFQERQTSSASFPPKSSIPSSPGNMGRDEERWQGGRQEGKIRSIERETRGHRWGDPPEAASMREGEKRRRGEVERRRGGELSCSWN